MATGNTIGKLQYAPAPQGSVKAGSANPPKSKNWWSQYGSWVHSGLDVLGAVPIVGVIADGANAVIYTAEGDYGNAALSSASVAANFIPGGGAMMKAGKLANKASRLLKEEKVAAKTSEPLTEKLVSKIEGKGSKKSASSTAEKNSGGQSTDKTQRKTAPCKVGGQDSDLITKQGVPLLTENPVNPLLGIKLLFDSTEQDFHFPATVSLDWQRYYFSDAQGSGWLGQGWFLPFSMEIEKKEGVIRHTDWQGREIDFPLPIMGGHPILHRYEQLWLSQQENGEFCLTDFEQSQHWHFGQQATSSHWLLSAISDNHGNKLTIEYDTQLLPVRIIDSAGRQFTLEFTNLLLENKQQVNRLTSVSLTSPSSPLDREPLCYYRYSPQGDLVAIANSRNEVTREYRYRNHILIAHRLAGELECFYHYDEHTPQGKVLAYKDNLGGEWQFTYAAGETTLTDSLGRVTRYQFNENKELIAFHYADGEVIHFTRNLRGLVTRVTDAAQRITRYRHDERGNTLAIIEADGQRTLFDYHDQWNKPIRITDMAGTLQEFTYDVRGSLIRHTDEGGRVTEYNHDDRGNIVRICDTRAGISQLTWNSANFLLSYQDCSGQTTHYHYDRYGWLSEQIDAMGNKTQLFHLTNGRLSLVIHPDGSKEHYEYDRWQRMITWQDSVGQITRWSYAPDNLLTARNNALGQQITYHYDSARRLTSLVNENGATYHFNYDARNQLSREQGFDGISRQYRYDSSGFLTESLETDSHNTAHIRTCYQRDAVGRLIEKVSAGTQRPALRSRFDYDELGRLVKASSEGGRVIFSWDNCHQLITEQHSIRGLEYRLQHHYDEAGHRTHTQLPDGRCIKNYYYGNGHRLQVNLDQRIITESERDARHQEIRRRQGPLTSEYQYDERGRLLSQRTSSTVKATKRLVSRDYYWRSDGQLMGINDQLRGLQQYHYDALGRLTEVGQERFSFDPAHNLLDDPHSVALQDNRVRVFEDKRWEYDALGDVSEKRIGRHTTQQFTWNAFHQLTEARSERYGNHQQTRYGYDALGRRTWKEDKFGVTRFIWDGDKLLSEIRGSQHQLYLYEEAHSFAPLAQIRHQQGETAANAEVFWYHNDVSGLPQELTNERGQVAWQASYRAWGNTLRVVAESQEMRPVSQPLRYQGQYYDEETGLHYNRFRYYDPDIGRFISQDPIGLAGGFNLYQYAPNPLTWIDPLGLSCSPSTKLNRKLRALEKAQKSAVNTRHLPDGRIRYYDKESLARTQGPTRGRSHVTEWDPKTGNVRAWEETYNHAGEVNRVHPKMTNGEILKLPHYPPTKADIDAEIATPSGRATGIGH